MKRLILTVLLGLICTGVSAEELGTIAYADTTLLLHKQVPIEDEFVKSDAFPRIIPHFVKETAPITDELVVPYEQSGKILKIWARKNAENNSASIDDELVTPRFVSNAGGVSILKQHHKKHIEDNFIKNNPNKDDIGKVNTKTGYDFSKSQIPVQLKIIKKLTTKNDIVEGNSVLFKTLKEICINGITLPKGTQVVGRVETVSESDKMGTPANIIVDNFYVKDHPEICFYGNVSKTGANRSIWVYPLYQAGNIMLYVAGFVFVPIHGGHAKLLTSDTYTVYYETR